MSDTISRIEFAISTFFATFHFTLSCSCFSEIKISLLRIKYIYRNPKDVCVSLWHHCKGFSVFEYDGPFEEFAELFLQGKVRNFWIIGHLSSYQD